MNVEPPCPLQVECQQEPGQQGQLTLTLQQQTVASDTEVRPAQGSHVGKHYDVEINQREIMVFNLYTVYTG